MTLIDGGYLAVEDGAIVGGIVTAAAVYLLAWRRSGMQGFRLLIVRVAMGSTTRLFQQVVATDGQPRHRTQRSGLGRGNTERHHRHGSAVGTGDSFG
ncbi:hypothetical protein ACI3KS_13950 [Microbacterium sp. ZW T5_45]|uniref:hypothetical protein n=1 Tax=Microbacterium sp. ZW T5_45 TaxID=3378080 RepID=UPI003854C2B8